jgi:hypothetical protein
VETTSVAHSVHFLGGILLFGGFAVVALILASLLHNDFTKACASQFRRVVKRPSA